MDTKILNWLPDGFVEEGYERAQDKLKKKKAEIK